MTTILRIAVLKQRKKYFNSRKFDTLILIAVVKYSYTTIFQVKLFYTKFYHTQFNKSHQLQTSTHNSLHLMLLTKYRCSKTHTKLNPTTGRPLPKHHYPYYSKSTVYRVNVTILSYVL